jgi:hypothetical protein
MNRFKHPALRQSLPEHPALLFSPPMTTRGLHAGLAIRHDFPAANAPFETGWFPNPRTTLLWVADAHD